MAATCTLTLALAATATAQDGVTYDPDSPAGREYALPLEEARGEGGGKGSTTSGGGSEASGGNDSGLFGDGITPRASAGSPTASSNGNGSSPSPSSDSPSPEEDAAADVPQTQPRPDSPVSVALSDGSSDSLLTGGVVALAALLAAGGLAVGVRRLNRPPLP